MANYRVTAKYVLLKVKDQASKATVSGFYEGAIVSDTVVDEEHLLRHLDRGWIEELDEPAAAPPVAPTPPAPVNPEPNPDAVPDGTAGDVLAWVGDNTDRAARALTVEQAKEKPRTTLVDQLTKLTGQA